MHLRKSLLVTIALEKFRLFTYFILLRHFDYANSQCVGAAGERYVSTINHTNLDQIEIILHVTSNSIQFTLKEPEHFKFDNITCKSITTTSSDHGQIVTADDNHICQGLEACVKYLVLLEISIINNNDSNKEISCEIQTSYTKPSIRQLRAVASQEEISLRWDVYHSSCILKLEVEAKSTDKTYKWVLANDVRNLIMDQLQPCQNHDIEIKAYDVEHEHVVSKKTITKSTHYAEPGYISLNFTIHEETDIKVQWVPPKYVSCIKNYTLRWSMRNCEDDLNTQAVSLCVQSANVTEPSINEYVIENLQGCETYDFEMFINDNDVPKVTSQFDSPTLVPSQINETYISSSITEVIISWRKPEVHPNCVTMYYVRIVGPTQRINSTIYNFYVPEGRNILVEDLEPCGQYNLSIKVLSENMGSESSWNSSFETLAGQPTKIRNVNVISQPYSVQITWNPPDFGDLCVDNYRFFGWDDDNKPALVFDKLTENTSISIDGLFSCQAYTLQIIPVAKNNTICGELTQIHVQTSAIEPAIPSIEVISINSNRLLFSAQESDANNKCEGIFARFICETRADARIKLAEKYVESHLGILYDADVFPLSPFTEYACSVSIYNVAGWSKNKTVIKTTQLYYPEQPRTVNLKLSTNNSLEFTWSAPQHSNGIVKIYIAHLKRIEAAFVLPKGCDPISPENTVRETTSLGLIFSDLLPFTRYSFEVAATNEFGISEYTDPYVVITNSWVSEPISNLITSPEGPYESLVEYKAYVFLTWQPPCRSNGKIEGFYLKFQGDRPGYESFYFSRLVKPNISPNGTFSYKETKLNPEYNYTVSISVKTMNIETLSVPVEDYFEAPAGIPQRLSAETIKKFKVGNYEDNNPAKTAIVKIPVHTLETKFGSIIYLALLLSQKNCDDEPQLKFGALNTNLEWPHSLSWGEAYGTAGCIHQYQTSPLRWKPSMSSKMKTAGADTFEFAIGTDDCSTSSNHYCNGPLQSNTEYNLVIRFFTKSGYNDVAILEFQTEALIDVITIVVSIITVFLFAFVAGLLYIWITKRIKWQRESCHGIEDSFGDTTPKNFFTFYNEISQPAKLAREFKDLSIVATDLTYSASEMSYSMNRYADIFPYNKNRVILDIDADGSDYINASFIDGYRCRKEYIAAQGPTADSTKDFWRMVLQHNIRIIVMVTQFREGDTIKCYKYFPFSQRGIEVSIKKRDTFDIYDRTELSVTHETYGIRQKVVHFYFKKWPDHNCPTDPAHLINFVRKVKAEKIPTYSPKIVHCSAGVGRTGTFIALDIIMQRLKNDSRINIYETVKKLRFQRMKMVQTLAQYTFLYECAYELVKTKYNSLKKIQPKEGSESYSSNTGYKPTSCQRRNRLNALPEEQKDESGQTNTLNYNDARNRRVPPEI